MMRRARLDIGPAIPGWALRAAIVLVAVAAAWGMEAPTGWMVALAAVAALGAVSAHTGGAWMAAGMLALLLLLLPFDHGRAAITVAAVHLLHVLAALTLVVRMRTRIAWRALAPTVRRFVLIQLIAQSLLACVLLVPTGGGAPWAAIVGALTVLLLAIGGLFLTRDGADAGAVRPAGGADVGGPS